jgi:plastocyanin
MRIGVVLCSSLVLALVVIPPAAAGPVRVVKLQDIDITPSTIRVDRGTTVRWRFLDDRVPHDVTSRGRPRFRGSETKSSGTHSVRFARRGTYRYVCTIHPSMRGKVVVR